MLVIKPRYCRRKRTGSTVNSPDTAVVGAKRKIDDLINRPVKKGKPDTVVVGAKRKIDDLINRPTKKGKGVIYE